MCIRDRIRSTPGFIDSNKVASKRSYTQRLLLIRQLHVSPNRATRLDHLALKMLFRMCFVQLFRYCLANVRIRWQRLSNCPRIARRRPSRKFGTWIILIAGSRASASVRLSLHSGSQLYVAHGSRLPHPAPSWSCLLYTSRCV